MSKCILLLVIISSLQGFSKGYSQDKISIKLRNVSLQTALKEITKQSDYRFLYSDAVLNGFDNKVTLEATDASINQIVSQVLANSDLSFKVMNANLVIITKPVAIAIPIKGKVTDSKGQPMPGVTVFEKANPTNAVVTDGDGNYIISVADRTSVVVIRYVGFVTQEINVGTQTTINASLVEENATLNEVVVVGYGTQKRASVTGAVSSVKGQELSVAPVPNISNSIVGRVSGVIGRQSGGGGPGSTGNTTFNIRGANTEGNNGALIVVDNIIRNNINQIDPNTIETVTVLKDAAATAPYGIGGANGVILITTKTGKTGAPTISFNAWYGTQTPTYEPKTLSAVDYIKLRLEAYYNENPTGTNPPYPKEYPTTYEGLNKQDPDRYPIATPYDIVQNNAPQQNYNVQVTGGSDRVKYYSNLGFMHQKGIYPQIEYTRYTFNNNLEAKVTNTTTFAMSVIASQEIDRNLDPQSGAGQLLRTVYKFIPTDPYRFSNGLWGASVGFSPLSTLNNGGYQKGFYNQILANVSLEQKLPLKGLSIKGVVGYDPVNQYQKFYHKPFYYYTLQGTAPNYTYNKVGSTSEGLLNYIYLDERYNRAANFTYQGYLNYHNTFGKHDITALVVAEARNGKNNQFSARKNNYALDSDEFNFGSSNKLDWDFINGTSATSSQVGYVYRVGDNFDNKYVVEASGRYDGLYSFAPGRRYAFFPSFSAGWILTGEDFMKRVKFVDYLKIRGSWGKNGNPVSGSPFQWQDSYGLAANAYAFGNGTVVQGSTPNPQANALLTWETAEKFDVGFEATMFKGALSLDVGLFKQKRADMLGVSQNTVSGEYGTALSQENNRSMENQGIEITASTRHRFANGLQLGLAGNFTYSQSKMTRIYENAATYNNPNRRRTGRPLGAQFGYKSLGLFHLADDKNGDGNINATDGYTISQFNVTSFKPGNIKYADISGPNGVPDGKVDVNDETFIGNRPEPLINYGFTLTANWKGFDASFFFQGSAMSAVGTQGFLTVPFINNNSNAGYEFFNNHWTPQNDMTARYPRVGQSPNANDHNNPTDFWIRDASFLRLKTASIGYTIPSSVIKAVGLKSLRIYTTGQNLLTFSKIKHIDPELAGGNGQNPAAETTFPIMRIWTFGLNASF